ncbi:carbohydrate ABC transporter permease [Labrys wisconsinensis]|uniref:Multiple sugar transport system permease protein n=1 Tax=Labrys wisconsinensis TaxID=425677 RepID=A0ABU0JCP3_9HYPH|nr:carbohydrate ABC transporter permease [Labrys wisconsinensis]MDQ0472054.1 multiple sugar transport system permease protein [Labrys wisconsinensis]
MSRPIPLLAILRSLILVSFLVFTLFPLFWIAKTSITPTALLYSEGVRLWPSRVTFDHFAEIWRWASFQSYFANSLVTALTASAVTTCLAALAGYGLSRWDFAGKKTVGVTFLVTQMVSIILIIVPLMKLLATVGLLDSLLGLSLVYSAINLPFAIFLMQSFFDVLPVQVEEAARLDGYGRFETFTTIVVPLALPGLGATLGFVFVEAWSELFLALTLLNTETEKTLPAGLLSLVSKLGVDWGQVSAAGLIALLPAVLFFAAIQRFLVAGLTAGAVKG